MHRSLLRSRTALRLKPSLARPQNVRGLPRTTVRKQNRQLVRSLRRQLRANPPMTRALHTSAPRFQEDMFCFQCEQTNEQKGCNTIGVCGKTPEVAALQDILCHAIRGIAMYARRARDLGASDATVDRFILASMFATLTNVNFDAARIQQYIAEAHKIRDTAKALYKKAGGQEDLSGTPAEFKFPFQDSAALVEIAPEFGVRAKQAKMGEDWAGVNEMAFYGLKGAAAYAEHAYQAGVEKPEIYAGITECLDDLTKEDLDLNDLLGLCLRVGEVNLGVLGALDEGNTSSFGQPEPTSVATTPIEGKCILVSGHDLVDLEALLQQTEGTGINVYTHGEMLPAHGYPKLAQYPHLAGHFGGPWQLQKMEFANFPGPIIVTTNCIMEPMKSYSDRLYTRSVVGWPGVKHLETKDFSGVIQQAQECEGFTPDNIIEDVPVTTGFGHNAVLGVADQVVEAVKSGAIKRFFVIGGCDGAERERSYFSELAENTPDDSIILTLGCGKYRFNRKDLGEIGGIPRVLDMGQCNDSYSAVQVAVALANAFETDVNSLPLSFGISWFEQKAVAVLLSLLHLNIQNIRLGPALPAFVTPPVLDVLVDKFKIKPIGDPKADLAQMNLGQ